LDKKSDNVAPKEGDEKKEFAGGPKRPPYKGKRTDNPRRENGTVEKKDQPAVEQKVESKTVEVTTNMEKTQAEKEN